MIKIENQITEIGGDKFETMCEFVVLFSLFKHFVNTEMCPGNPELATKLMLETISIGFNNTETEEKAL